MKCNNSEQKITKNENIIAKGHLGRLMEAFNKLLIVQQLVLIRLSAGEQELCLRLGVVLVALHCFLEVSFGDDTCEQNYGMSLIQDFQI